MSTRFFLRVLMICCFVLAVFLAVEVIYQSDASASVSMTAKTNPLLAGSDWIERHPSTYHAGSDWIERHPSTATRNGDYLAGSDWIERHPSTYYAGSDWIERHPGSVQP